jgi:transcriptional regulator with XRE-family HTH domain
MRSVDPERQRIAAEVRAEMARQQKTQREVGEILDLPQASIYLRLQAKRAFRAEELAKLAEAFGVPISRFFPDAVSAA